LSSGRGGVRILNARHHILVHLRQIAHHGAQARDLALRVHQLMLEVFVGRRGVGELALQFFDAILLRVGLRLGCSRGLPLLAVLRLGGRGEQKTGHDD